MYGNNIPVSPGSTYSVVVGARATTHAQAGGGAVRIIWGTNRAFPSTNTGNV